VKGGWEGGLSFSSRITVQGELDFETTLASCFLPM
jgi:hypothetical protein